MIKASLTILTLIHATSCATEEGLADIAQAAPGGSPNPKSLTVPGREVRAPAAKKLGIFAGLFGRGRGAAARPQLFAWQQGPNHLALMRGGQIVWQFNHDPAQPMPYFHPVSLPGGPPLTWHAPPDHPWHNGLWFAWKYINGVNYWEFNPQTGRQDGITSWSNVRVRTMLDFSACIELDLTYQPGTNGPPVVVEKRTILVSAPADDGGYRMDWFQTFTACAKLVRFDRTPLPGEPGGAIWGGYSGLSVRFASNLLDRVVSASAGPVTFTEGRYRGRAMAVDYTGRLANQWMGIALVDSPANPNSPSPWYVMKDDVMSFLSPAVIYYEPLTLKPREQLRLSYRTIVHPGAWGREQLRSAAQAFQQGVNR